MNPDIPKWLAYPFLTLCGLEGAIGLIYFVMWLRWKIRDRQLDRLIRSCGRSTNNQEQR
jgi:hypothetical protein